MSSVQLLQGDCLAVLKTLSDQSIQTCVTSPPYFGLRDYGVEGQVGLEESPDEYVQKLVDVFRELKRVLRNDGTLWLNLGDTYGKGKQLLGVPWSVAFALQADGWVLRQDIIWNKPNPMPESVRDRCTKAHEYIFLLSKFPKYYFDASSIGEEAAPHRGQVLGNRDSGTGKARGVRGQADRQGNFAPIEGRRNRRSVWAVTPKPYRGAHFATFPPDLIRPCILAGAPKDGVVLDPFNGSGTTGQVCVEEGRSYIGIDLNPEYIKLSEERIAKAKAVNTASLLDDLAA